MQPMRCIEASRTHWFRNHGCLPSLLGASVAHALMTAATYPQVVPHTQVPGSDTMGPFVVDDSPRERWHVASGIPYSLSLSDSSERDSAPPPPDSITAGTGSSGCLLLTDPGIRSNRVAS